MTTVKRRARVSDTSRSRQRLAGGRKRDGAAEIWLAGVAHLPFLILRDEIYLVDNVAFRVAAGIATGDEVLRRRRTVDTAPTN